MSVINKMLRDLDQHKTTAPKSVPVGVQATGGPRRGSAGLAQPQLRWVVAASLLLMAVALGVWLGTGLGTGLGRSSVPVLAPTTAPQPTPTVTLTAEPALTGNPTPAAKPQTKSPSTPPTKPESTAASAVSASLGAVVHVVKRPQLAASTPTLPSAASASSAAVSVSAAKPTPPQPMALAPAPLAGPAPSGNVQAADHVPPPAGRLALAQAQGLWREGAQAAAFELLRGALAWSHTAATPPDQATLSAMAREHARMALVLGKGAESLALLQQLEPRLSGMAEVWATRGQVAQRLGQHPEAVRAYQQALTLVPGQPRWMLGAAISLAVQGQLGLAAEWAERARSMGALTPEVRAYLAQLGVSVGTD